MGIRFLCPNGHKLNVKAELAGKRGSCPECGAKLQIPAATAAPQAVPEPLSQPAAAAAPSAPAIATVVAAPAAATWHFRATSGEQHGPLSELQFRASIAAGRVTADTLLWREGWPEWRPARSVADLLPTPLVATAVAAPLAPTPPAAPTTPEPAAPSLDNAAAVNAVDESADDDEIAVDTEESGTADPAALATSRYVYQRRKSKQQQITLAVAMFVAVVVLAAVLYFVISLNSGAATDAPATSANTTAAPTANPRTQKAIS